MKTRSIGIGALPRQLPQILIFRDIAPLITIGVYSRVASACQKDYRKNRENGDNSDNPQRAFPSAGFDALGIQNSDEQDSSKKWPDEQGRYWWKLTLKDGSVNNDFYWAQDKVRGYPDKDNKDRHWFSIHHAPSNTIITGFSQEPDYEKGFPNKSDGFYYYRIQFSDEHSPAIRQWMEEKDYNYLKRISVENSVLFETELAELKAVNPTHPAIAKLIPPPLPLPPVPVVKKALYDYKTVDLGQLSFAKGDVLTLLKEDRGGWSYCVDAWGKEGWIPSNYVVKVNFKQEEIKTLIREESEKHAAETQCLEEARIAAQEAQILAAAEKETLALESAASRGRKTSTR